MVVDRVSCPNCARVPGTPTGVVLADNSQRLAAFLLDAALILLTCGIGWIVWSLFTWSNGQTPAKKILKMRTIVTRNREVATWGRMCMRELLCKQLIHLAASSTFLVLYFWPLWDRDHQELWDKMVDTVVVKETA